MMRIFAQSLNGFKKENTIIGERPLLAHSELGISTSEPDWPGSPSSVEGSQKT